jgi:hypothetical protein
MLKRFIVKRRIEQNRGVLSASFRPANVALFVMAILIFSASGGFFRS